ncbi:MAG: class I SAM-dependent methyltransferase [bacterium]|nr:class I SAM-dependent methyltransferase [bacterium]
METKNACPVCRAKKFIPRFIKNGYPIERCSSCGFERAVMHESYTKLTDRYYTKGYFTGEKERYAYSNYAGDFSVFKKNFDSVVRLLLHFTRGRTLLDVGCAYGFFMQVAKKHGFDVFGIDVSAHAIREAKEIFGGNVNHGRFDEVIFPPASFDAITMLDVFEHFDDPASSVRRARKLLNRDGILVIETNDTQSLWAKMFGRDWHFYIPPQHLSFFSAANMTMLLEKEGFRVEAIRYSGKWIPLRYALHLARSIRGSKLAESLYHRVRDMWLGRLPLYINFFDHMIVIARKI